MSVNLAKPKKSIFKRIPKWSILLVIYLTSAYIFFFVKDEKDILKPTAVVVLGKFEASRGKSYSDLLLFLKEKDTNREFTLEVAPKTFYFAQEGEVLVFKLSEYDITNEKSYLSFFIGLNSVLFIIASLGVLMLFIGFILIFADDKYRGVGDL